MEVSIDSHCYLCDSFFAQSQEPYVVYKCFCCMKFTPYCIPCELKMQKLFGRGNFFKCIHCNKLTNAIDKLEINPSNQQKNLSQIRKGISLNNSFFKTPQKPFIESNVPISSIKCNNSGNNNYLINSINGEERKDNNSNGIGNSTMLSNFINEFKMINLALNSNKNELSQNCQNQNCFNINDNYMNNTISGSVNGNNIDNHKANKILINSGSMQNLNNVSDHSILKSKARLNKRFILNNTFLGKKRDESDKKSEFRGYNKSKDKKPSSSIDKNVLGTTKTKRIITRKMHKICKTDADMSNFNTENIELKPAVNDFRKENVELSNIFMNKDGSFCFPSVNDSNISSSLFINQNTAIGHSSMGINGTVTPHRILDNTDGQYF
jgi:hypothetical protein